MNRPDGAETMNPATGEITTTGGELPAPIGAIPKDITEGMPLALRIYFDNDLYNRTKQVAQLMANAVGFTPQHLIHKSEACFAITTISLRTGIDPFFLAQNTYQTPGGQVGYMTRAVQAIIDQSGVLKRVPQRHYSGDWDKLVGMFKIEKSQKNKDYAVPTWTKENAKGLKLKIILEFKDQDEPEEFEMELTQAFPLFSTMWATDPKTQFFNLVCRRAVNTLRPGALAGVRHSDDLISEEAAPRMKDITPKSAKSGSAGLDEFAAEPTPAEETIVEPDPVEDDKAEPNANANANAKAGDDTAAKTTAKPKSEAAKAKSPPKTDSDNGKVTIWISADEPAREIKNIDSAVFVIGKEIQSAKTPALAQAVFNQNVDVISKADKETQDRLEARLQRRLDKGDGDEGGANGTLV